MSLVLDKRQRAMLREMGVRVWQPAETASVAGPEVAMNSGATSAHIDWAAASKGTEKASFSSNLAEEIVAPPVGAHPGQASRPAARATTAPSAEQAGHPAAGHAGPVPDATGSVAGPAWQLGNARTLYATDPLAPGARWLVLAETPAASLRAADFDPLAGDAGQLLGNMLRAARLPQAALATLVPLARLAAAGPQQSALPDALAALFDKAQPGVVLIMGRLAAQAALQTAEPLGKLRGQVHRLHGVAAVVTYDAAYLLRNPLDKAKAWDDLQLAMATVAASAA